MYTHTQIYKYICIMYHHILIVSIISPFLGIVYVLAASIKC
jgi:hypothetical protein